MTSIENILNCIEYTDTRDSHTNLSVELEEWVNFDH
jgi:hypothetical protein